MLTDEAVCGGERKAKAVRLRIISVGYWPALYDLTYGQVGEAESGMVSGFDRERGRESGMGRFEEDAWLMIGRRERIKRNVGGK